MRHRKRQRKLGRTSEHRSALFRNQVASMVRNERIVTTLAKAKELRPIIEKMVTLGREDTVHHRRRAAVSVPDKSLIKRLFEEIGPRFGDRPGGYTRIVKLGPRRGDGAEMAILEFVDYELGGGEPAPAPKKSKKAKADETETEGEEPEEITETGDEKKAPKKAASKKSGAKKSPSKKPAAKKSPSKKPAAKKSSSKKSSSKKSGAKKSSTKSSKKSSSKKSSKKKS